MNKLFALMAILSVSMPAMAAAPAGRGRASMSTQMESRVAAVKDTPEIAVVAVEEETEIEETVDKDMREREKAACIQNNIGVGNTFVWASKYSDTSNYASMIEDIENPVNNVCFVKVAMKSDDTRVDISDIPTKYFVMGDTITCGAWADNEVLRQRILDAKKKGRTWATVGGAVGGAAVGVGAMELFGNDLLAKAGVEKVAGSKEIEYCSYLQGLDEKEKSSAKENLNKLKTLCDAMGDNKPSDCNKYKYNDLLKCVG